MAGFGAGLAVGTGFADGVGFVSTFPACAKAICRSLCFCQLGLLSASTPATGLGATEAGFGTRDFGAVEGVPPGLGGGFLPVTGDTGFLDTGGGMEGGGEDRTSSSSGRLSATLRVRAFLTNSGSLSCDSVSPAVPLCCGVLRSWLAQGAMCLSSESPSLFFFSKSSKFVVRLVLAFLSISFISSPPPDTDPLDFGGGWAFFLLSLPFLP